MAERDLHTAFQNLKEDVMSNVQTERQLEKITERRGWVRPGLVAFAGAAALVLLIGASLLVLRPSDPTDTVPPATGSTAPPSTLAETSTPPTTSGLIETTTTSTPPSTSDAPETTTIPPVSVPALDAGMVLIAQPGGRDFSLPAIDTDSVAVNADVAVGDRQGGLIIESGETVSWGRPDMPMVALCSGAAFAVSEIRLEDSAVIDGEVNVIFIVAGGVEEERYEQVWSYRLSDGELAMLYETGAYEGGIRRASLQNDTLVITRHAEGFSWFEFFTAAGDEIEVANPKPDMAEFPVVVDHGVLSPDGTTLVYLAGDSPAPPEAGNWRVDLIVFDLENGNEDRRMEIELGNWYSARMDYDGSGVVIGRIQWDGEAWQNGPALRIDSLDPDAGIVTEYQVIGIPSLVR